MKSQLVKNGYNEIAQKYSARRDQFKNQKYLKQLAKLLKPGAIILDIGCGSAVPVDKFFTDKGFKVIGIDISEKQIELAKINVPQANFEIKDMSEFKESEYKADAVVSFYAIFHVSRQKHQELFKKINSFLPQGGYILVTMGAGEWEGVEEDFHGTKMWWSHYGVDQNRQIIQTAGFEILLNEIDTSGGERHQIVLARKH